MLWVVWDTVRADHLSLYGYPRSTTPFLEEWAKQGRVFDDCQAVASTTVPAHASMFTGWMPSEHGAHNSNRAFPESCDTIAEKLSDAGYRTFLYAANPFVSRQTGLDQGFDVVEHPWQDKLAKQAVPLLLERAGRVTDADALARNLDEMRGKRWAFKSLGELARLRVQRFLRASEASQPFFVFLNYMEAHFPVVPSEQARQRFMEPPQVEASFRQPPSVERLWGYTFGVVEMGDAELQQTVDLYDAALFELDALFSQLLGDLEDLGLLENTLVILTADHGEHLGDHHLLDHQYSLYEPLLNVPLVLRGPGIEPGRDARAVTNLDLFPTLMEYLDLPTNGRGAGLSLLGSDEHAVRISESPDAPLGPVETVRVFQPNLDPTRWLQSRRSLERKPYKYIRTSAGEEELYDLVQDPGEQINLRTQLPDVARDFAATLAAEVAAFRRPPADAAAGGELTEDERAMLESLGYVSGKDESDD